MAPAYMSDIIHPYVPARTLRSSSSNLLQMPSARTITYGERAFFNNQGSKTVEFSAAKHQAGWIGWSLQGPLKTISVQTGIWLVTLSFTVFCSSLIILPAQPQDLILLQFLLSSSYPAGAAAGSYIASVSSSSFFFFLLLLLSVNIAISPTAYMVWPCDSGIFISLMTATKLMGLEIHLRSFGVTGVKKVNHVKNMKTDLI